MKRIATITLALLLVFSSGIMAFADSPSQELVPILISAPVDETSDNPILISDNTPLKVSYLDEVIEFDVTPQKVGDVIMIPLRVTLEKMGYTVTWNESTSSVEISKGNQWTTVKINQNSYFKNKIAPEPLSAAPILKEGRTLVPAEFFNAILGKGIQIENGNLKLNDGEMAIHSGYIKDIAHNQMGTMSLTIVTDLASNDVLNEIIIHTSNTTTYYNKEVKKGEFVNVISALTMTMSIPGQTSGYIIY